MAVNFLETPFTAPLLERTIDWRDGAEGRFSVISRRAIAEAAFGFIFVVGAVEMACRRVLASLALVYGALMRVNMDDLCRTFYQSYLESKRVILISLTSLFQNPCQNKLLGSLMDCSKTPFMLPLLEGTIEWRNEAEGRFSVISRRIISEVAFGFIFVAGAVEMLCRFFLAGSLNLYNIITLEDHRALAWDLHQSRVDSARIMIISLALLVQNVYKNDLENAATTEKNLFNYSPPEVLQITPLV